MQAASPDLRLLPPVVTPERVLFALDYPEEPQPWRRVVPVAQGVMLNRQDYRAYKRAVARAIGEAMGGRAPASGPCGFRALFYRSSYRPCDIDNLTKACLDAGKSIAWEDDKQVLEIGYVRLYPGSERPRMVLLAYMLEGREPVARRVRAAPAAAKNKPWRVDRSEWDWNGRVGAFAHDPPCGGEVWVSRAGTAVFAECARCRRSWSKTHGSDTWQEFRPLPKGVVLE